jgi:hypothetical protein
VTNNTATSMQVFGPATDTINIGAGDVATATGVAQAANKTATLRLHEVGSGRQMAEDPHRVGHGWPAHPDGPAGLSAQAVTWAVCDRCNFKRRLAALRRSGPASWSAQECYDPKPPDMSAAAHRIPRACRCATPGRTRRRPGSEHHHREDLRWRPPASSTGLDTAAQIVTDALIELQVLSANQQPRDSDLQRGARPPPLELDAEGAGRGRRGSGALALRGRRHHPRPPRRHADLVRRSATS